MAKEIKLTGAGTGRNLYAVAISPAGMFWNGSVFGAYSAGVWPTYAIALTEIGAGIYMGNFPVVAAGLYTLAFYERAGAAPAVTDIATGQGTMDWDGTKETGLNTAVALPGQGAPPAFASLIQMASWLMKAWRNRTSQKRTGEYKLYDDLGVNVDQKAMCTDDNITFERSGIESGP